MCSIHFIWPNFRVLGNQHPSNPVVPGILLAPIPVQQLTEVNEVRRRQPGIQRGMMTRVDNPGAANQKTGAIYRKDGDGFVIDFPCNLSCIPAAIKENYEVKQTGDMSDSKVDIHHQRQRIFTFWIADKTKQKDARRVVGNAISHDGITNREPHARGTLASPSRLCICGVRRHDLNSVLMIIHLWRGLFSKRPGFSARSQGGSSSKKLLEKLLTSVAGFSHGPDLPAKKPPPPGFLENKPLQRCKHRPWVDVLICETRHQMSYWISFSTLISYMYF